MVIDGSSVFDQNIKLVRIPTGGVNPKMGTVTPLETASSQRLQAILVAMPVVVAALYFFLLAAGRYESEATFVVRSPTTSAVSQVANLVQGTGIVSSSEDAYIVHEYLLSRDAMRSLLAYDGLLAIFRKSGWDPLWSVPGFFGEPSEEKLYKHYQRFVSVSFDKTTGISTLKVQAFTAEDARRIVAALMKQSETLLNRLNERSHTDAVVSAERQVEDSKRRSYQARDNMTAFRNRESVIDPTLLSTAVVETVARLSLEMALLNAQLAELRSSSPYSPQVSSIGFRLAALDSQIAKERGQLGGNNASLAPRVAEYDRLLLEREFADQAFTSAMSTLEVARVDALRQRTFLEQISSPNLPDYPKYPYRVVWIIAIAAGVGSLYWIGRKLVLDVFAHAGK
jgi:capsular polysaccharide transport system permease protein